MLQREIIEETDLFSKSMFFIDRVTFLLSIADNRSKVQRKRAKTMDYTALVKRPVKGSLPFLFFPLTKSPAL